MDKLTDEDLIELLRKGEREKFEIIIRRYNQSLYRIGRMLNITHDEILQFMQDTFIETYHYLKQNAEDQSCKLVLINKMMKNCGKYLESQKNKEIPNDKINHNELDKIVEEVVCNLPLEERIVYTLLEINRLDLSEVSLILSLSKKEVEKRNVQAKESIRKAIENLYQPSELFEFNLIYCDAMVENVMSKINNK